jgi:hypothetical protein
MALMCFRCADEAEMSDEKPTDQPQDQPPKQERPAYEQYIERLKANPRFVRVEPTGAGFVVGGFPSAAPKPKQG